MVTVKLVVMHDGNKATLYIDKNQEKARRVADAAYLAFSNGKTGYFCDSVPPSAVEPDVYEWFTPARP